MFEESCTKQDRCDYLEHVVFIKEDILYPTKKFPIPFRTIRIDHLDRFVTIKNNKFILVIDDSFEKISFVEAFFKHFVNF